MSITFGAVGDIISVALLAKDLLATLDEARGSKAEYRAAIQAIKTLNDTINLVNLHVIQQGITTPELRNLCETSKQAVARCRSLGDGFLARLRRYQTTFDKSHGRNKIKEMAMAVRWRIGEKEALEQFHAEILGASLSLQTLLATANFSLLSMNRNEMNAKLDAAQIESHATIISQNTSLNVLVDGVKNANSKIEAGNSILAKVSEALRFDRIRQLGAELRGLMRGVMAVNFATYRAVIRLESALPSHLERRLIEDPMILEDPIGRIAPVHLQFINSWDAFNAVLEGRFHDREGYKKMKQREYGLQTRITGKEIEQSRSWQSAFSPGQHIEMSFVFNQDDVGESGNTICPGCRTPSSYSTDADIQCTECQMFFRRITVIQDDESSSRDTPLAKDQHTREFVSQAEAADPSSRKRTFDELAEREEEDVRSFKRVRLVSKRKRADKLGLFSPGMAERKLELDIDAIRPNQGDEALMREIHSNQQDHPPGINRADHQPQAYPGFFDIMTEVSPDPTSMQVPHDHEGNISINSLTEMPTPVGLRSRSPVTFTTEFSLSPPRTHSRGISVDSSDEMPTPVGLRSRSPITFQHIYTSPPRTHSRGISVDSSVFDEMSTPVRWNAQSPITSPTEVPREHSRGISISSLTDMPTPVSWDARSSITSPTI